MNNKLCGIGEALIDFIPEIKGQRLKDVASFKRVAGGASSNVVGAVTKLGIPSKFKYCKNTGGRDSAGFCIPCIRW